MDWKRGEGPKDRRRPQPYVARLKGLELFASLADRMLDQVVQLSSRRVYQRGEEVRQAAHRADAAHIVVDGSVDVLHVSPDGRELKSARLEAGGVFDFATELEAESYVTVAEVISAIATICTAPWSVFLRAVIADPHAAAVFIEQQRWQLEQAEHLASELAFAPISTRVRHWLRRLAQQRGQSVVSCTLEELARSTGTREEEVSRVIGQLQRRGLVMRRGRGRIGIPNPDELS